jgi:hypothetical protein
MKKIKQHWFRAMFGLAVITCCSLYAATGIKDYQVTGPVLEVNPTSVTVQKGSEKWVLHRTSATRVDGDLKVGAKVTISYKMVATEIEVREATEKK